MEVSQIDPRNIAVGKSMHYLLRKSTAKMIGNDRRNVRKRARVARVKGRERSNDNMEYIV